MQGDDDVQENSLYKKEVSKIIERKFTIPAYQRGYRWGKKQVMELLEDIYSSDQSLCLQPIVVKRKGDNHYELIDGQQRLTTLYLIYRFMKDEGYNSKINLPFPLEYETRPKSAEYLTRPDEKNKDDNVDFYHIYHSYQAIKEWFGKDANQAKTKADTIYPKFDNNVFVIWYEVDEKTDAPGLFTRLNAGRIPLTNSELIKARLLLVVKTANGSDDERGRLKQIEIATQWDTIERGLHNEEFWAFLTNAPGEECSARIELVFDLLADKKQEDKDEFHTFRWFEEKLDGKGGVDELWNTIQETFQTLRGWYEDRDLYHKVGYLVAEGKTELSRLVRESQGKTKSAFKNFLDDEIRGGLQGISCDDLSYENGADKDKIQRILRLFNVELLAQVKNSLERYPFSLDKSQNWSLEHIHAQNAESLRKEDEWREWLTKHREVLEEIAQKDKALEDLAGEIEIALGKKEIGGEAFRNLQGKIIAALSAKEDDFQVDLHGLGNLAFMPQGENAALSNSVFAVKRKKLIEMDKAGCYIPIGTRWVFLKYYGDGQNCLHYWYKSDYDAYLNEIKTVLRAYLPKEDGR